MAGSPKPGDAAPSFELPGTGDRLYRLADYAGKNLILAFYPGDFSPVCTKQFCSYRDNGDQLGELDADLLGISPQPVESHERFMAEHSLNVPLLADEDRSVAAAYGITVGPLTRRAIFLIDEEGVVRFRKVTLFGLSFEGVDELARMVREHAG